MPGPQGLDKNKFHEARTTVISAIMHTDMSMHQQTFDMLVHREGFGGESQPTAGPDGSDLCCQCRPRPRSPVAHSPLPRARSCRSLLAAGTNPTEADRKDMVNTIVHAMDLNNVAIPWTETVKWAKRVGKEFSSQVRFPNSPEQAGGCL